MATKNRKQTETTNVNGTKISQTATAAGGPPNSSTGQVLTASGSHQSALFKLQLDEFLGTIRTGNGRRHDRIGTLLRQLKWILNQVPEQGGLPVCRLFDESKI